MVRYWLCKSEPHAYSISDLEKEKTGQWDGIRNYQARNFIRDMKEDDISLFYHSSCKEPGIYGSMTVTSSCYPDPTAVEKGSKYMDKRIKSPEDNPWSCVDVKFREHFPNPLLLPHLKSLPLGVCPLTAKGSRLSVMSLSDEQFTILMNEIKRLNDGDEEIYTNTEEEDESCTAHTTKTPKMTRAPEQTSKTSKRKRSTK